MPREITRESKYAFLLSQVRELEPGKANIASLGHEFTCLVQSFSGVVYAAAATKGYAATVVTFPDQGVVVYAFYKPDNYLRPNLKAYPVVRKMAKF